ncbi:exodeoxyribonuclease III [Engelhardtia mirabilis]|uniref:Exodeoxyribonuclease III n=1 Tax=Engelhardtia mirabilis TaxID=2528011 RepID=A0A518BHV2_9BACT|nr:Exodeoxyribonuclease III [Planctomycetes bacterium Pla133]QDV00872.1 Exodeoxyribonuclease III [Planctomycetes bacterium Pla86]
MRCATWNVNSIRARLPRVLEWLERQSPDVVCLQETKCLDEVFPREPIEDLGYNIETFGQKTYNGVAILAKGRIEEVHRGLPGDESDIEARVIGAQVEDFLFLDLYVVNGQEVGAPKYSYKLEWLERVRRLIDERYDLSEKVVVTGDFNITFDDRDVYDPEKWRGKILCSDAEREALARIMDLGLIDGLRQHTEEAGIYTWWDFRTRGFQRGNGLRIDHFLLSEAASKVCTAVEVDTEERGLEKPSDHAPVIATFE